MARYPNGQPVRLSSTVSQLNADGTTTLVNASTTVYVVKIANVDGTTSTTGTYSSPVNDSTGKYHQDIPVTDLVANGHYQWTFTTTGPGAGVQVGDFDVFDPFEPALLPLPDAKQGLNWNTSTANDDEILRYIATIQTSMEAMTAGPLVNRVITERAEFSCDMQTIQVKQRPLVKINSIVSVPNGATVDISAGLDYDVWTGEARLITGSSFSAFSRIATVTYVAGWGAQMPAAFTTAAGFILQYLWTAQHGPSGRPNQGGAAMQTSVIPGFPYAIPNGAAQLLRGSLNGLPFIPEVFA